MNEQSSVTSVATTLEMFTHWKIIKFRMSFAIVDITTCTCSTDSPSQEKDPTTFICCYYVSALKKWSSGELVWKCINFDVPSTRPAKKKKRNPVGVEMLGRLNVPQLKKAKLYSQKVHSYPHHNYAFWDQASWEQRSCLQFDINLLW